ncbi:solute carrier family 15 member 1 [Ambystoma mexicanum]|uniref:solute carrier family 15 member 1 n=1 Tax=Ambystoma mexicanum TaxID=8296 RepID=UPI0037E8133C
MGKDEKEKSKSPSCHGYPLSVFIIVINEFCERFSYYGMRAVLVLYFKYFLLWDDNLATIIYHAFAALCYFTPLMGAIIADSWLGKFKTIIYLSIVYAVGQVILAISSINDLTDHNKDGTPDTFVVHVALSMTGLLLIAIGTGGIKPCVAAFGGDQFEDHQEKQRGRFFSIFYLAINAGSLLSTIITPILRGEQCGIHTKQQCYPLAFGVPAALMFVALIVFISGSSLYRKVAPQGNILAQVCSCIGFAIKNRFRNRSKAIPKREHWMDWAKEKYDERLIAQIKMVVKVLFLYIPLPMFWALYDQQGSRWTLQATTMDGNFGAITIQPDQMQTVNPILIIILVPIVDGCLYPLIKKCKLNFTPLRRITVGMFLAATAFIVAAVVQMEIDKTLPTFPNGDQIQLRVLNLGPNEVSITYPPDASLPPVKIPSLQADNYKLFKTNPSFNINVNYGSQASAITVDGLQGANRYTLLLKPNFSTVLSDVTKKPEQGNNEIRFINNIVNSTLNITVDGAWLQTVNYLESSNYTMVKSGAKNISVALPGGPVCSQNTMAFGFGSSYTFVIDECSSSTGLKLNSTEDIQPNSVHMALQIPQYFILTAGEVVFSVTGLEFSYSQAPSNMKAVLQGGWQLTVAFGNVIVLIVAGASRLEQQWAEYFLFAALLFAVCIIFSIMAYFYTYVDPAEIEAQFDDPDRKKKEKEIAANMYENGDGPFSQTKM